jgi:N6-L-threonylcarbamoyladenine synthase
MFFIGMDSSCYTSSIAIVDEQENLIYDGRRLLEVARGSRGLRQSEAVFQHMNNLPALCAEAMSRMEPQKLAAVGVSASPTTQEGSYMPVFTAGHNIARVIASCTGASILKLSHQQGHILAGAWSIGKQMKGSHLVYHISGGTSELLLAGEQSQEIRIVGGTEDLNAGQYIDRVGVALGMKFPCGKELDSLCRLCGIQDMPLPVSVKGSFLSFSGPESHVQRLIRSNSPLTEEFKAAVAYAVFKNIGVALERTILNACVETGVGEVLLVGGVASNSVIREHLLQSSKFTRSEIQIAISKPEYSSDNAVGAAIYAKRTYMERESIPARI